MNIANNYNIAFKGLDAGVHRFEFEAGDKFFESFGQSEIKGGSVSVGVDLTKAVGTLVLGFEIRGQVVVECDRCLEDCSLPVDFSGELTVKFTDSEMDQAERYDGEVMWLSPQDGEVNLAQYIYESVVLSLPYQRVHPEQDGAACNAEMLARFRVISQAELDQIEESAQKQKLAESPEWEKLEKLKAQMTAEEDK